MIVDPFKPYVRVCTLKPDTPIVEKYVAEFKAAASSLKFGELPTFDLDL
jgi:hypothetical protein